MANQLEQNDQTFLWQLSDRLRAESGVEAVGNRATQLIAQRLMADRVYLVSLNPDNDLVVVTHETRRQDMPPLQGSYHSSDFPSAIKEIFERTIVYADVRTDTRLTELDRLSFAGLGAVGFMATSLRRGGQTMIWAAGAVSSTPRDWTAGDVALFENAVERTWAAVQRANADQQLRQSEAKYRTLFNSIDDGFSLIELIFDEAGKVIDYWHREHNPVFMRMTGLTDAIGKRMSELVPELEPEWHRMLETIYYTGEPLRIEYPVKQLGQWYRVYLSRMGGEGSPFIACVYDEITERKRREANQQLVVAIWKELGQLSQEEEIMRIVGTKLTAHLGITCYHYVDIDEDRDEATVRHFWHALEVPAILGTYPLRAFVSPVALAAWRAGKPTIINDIEQELPDETPEAVVLKAGAAAQQISAFIAIGLSQEGKWKAYFAVADSHPRAWTNAEIELVQEVAGQLLPRIERARAEEALRTSQRRFESIANLVPDLLWDSNPDGSTNWYNQRWLEYTGQRFEEAIGWGWTNTIHPDERAASAQHYDQAVATGTVLRQEHRIRRHDGAYRWFVVSTVPLKNQRGQVVKMYGAATDIHDRKLVEATLQASEKRFRLAIEATELATWEWHLDTNEVYWNEQHFRLFGLEPRPNPISPDAFMRHVHAQDKARIKGLLERAIAERVVYDAEFLAVLADGSERWMSGYGRITEERNGQPIKMSGVMLDVDDRRRAEDALRLADRRKDEFLAMLAHELRNPMSTIQSGLQILAITNGKDKTSSATLGMMHRQTDHLVRMVDDLLDVSRISRGKIDLKTERVNLVELVEQAVQSVGDLYQEQGKHLQVELPTSPIYLEGDATRLTQVVTNLMTNGARYTGEQGQIEISLRHKGKEVLLQVRDNGIGLAADQLRAIFELFVQVDNSLARAKGGLGLGLTLVKRLVEMHGGRVEAQSPGIGQGSTFTVHLPTLTIAAEPTPLSSSLQATDSATTQRILVIDDNADAALMMTMLLQLKGYETHSRNSGRAGIEAAERLQPAAILLDIGMPELDGYATCGLIRQQAWGQGMVIIALTGYGQQEDRRRTQEAGFDGHLVKPVELDTLTKLLTDLLGK